MARTMRHPHSFSVMAGIEWEKLRHAYGDAGDVPALLERARRAPAGGHYTDEPWFSLWSALCHQGDVYTASYAAVPELVAIARARIAEHAAARECLLLAGTIELERALPEGIVAPPPIPGNLLPAYTTALAEGAQLAQIVLDRERHPDYVKGLTVARTAMQGDAAEARRLDRSDDDDDDDL